MSSMPGPADPSPGREKLQAALEKQQACERSQARLAASRVIQVWLNQRGFDISVEVVTDDGTLLDGHGHHRLRIASSYEMRTAKREITGTLADMGFIPAGRWRFEDEMDGWPRASRYFCRTLRESPS